jgi:hypothetical protein
MRLKPSSNCKRQLYLLSNNSNDINLIKYCKQYCKILAKVITEAKGSKYNNQIINSTNKMKTTLNIIKSETNRLYCQSVRNYKNSINPSKGDTIRYGTNQVQIHNFCTIIVLLEKLNRTYNRTYTYVKRQGISHVVKGGSCSRCIN